MDKAILVKETCSFFFTPHNKFPLDSVAFFEIHRWRLKLFHVPMFQKGGVLYSFMSDPWHLLTFLLSIASELVRGRHYGQLWVPDTWRVYSRPASSRRIRPRVVWVRSRSHVSCFRLKTPRILIDHEHGMEALIQPQFDALPCAIARIQCRPLLAEELSRFLKYCYQEIGRENVF